MENNSKRRSKTEINQAIREHFDRQAGRISFDQLRDLGLDAAAIARRRASGELILDGRPKPPKAPAAQARRTALEERRPDYEPTLNQRVYRSPGADRGPDGIRWSAVLSAPGGLGLLDHVSACQLLGVDELGAGATHVIAEGSGWIGPTTVNEHRSRSIPKEDRTNVRGIPTVILPRALLSAAVDVPETRLHDILDTAVRLKRYDGAAMIRVVEARSMLPGYPAVTRAIAMLDATSGTFRSIFERRTLRLMERSQLIPPAVVNVMLEGFRPDIHLPGTRVIIECDGRDYHRSPAQIIADDRRQEILEALGYRFLRLRWADVVYEEERALARIERFVIANMGAPVPVR